MLRARHLGGMVALSMALACGGAGKSSSKPETRPAPIAVPCSQLTLPSIAPSKRGVIPIPDANEQTRVEKEIRRTYDFKNLNSPADRVALAAKLLQVGIDTEDDIPARYVLWRNARDLAATAGDANLACRAVRRIEDEFAIELPVTLLTAVTAASHAATTSATCANVAQSALTCVDQAAALDDFETAERLINVATAAADRARNPALINRVASRAKELAAAAGEFPKVKAAIATLRDKPEDAEGNLLAGSFYCFNKCDWDRGLPMLARCSDAAMHKLAQAELDAKESIELIHYAEEWWAVSDSKSGLCRRHVQAHAVTLYRRALPGLKTQGMTRDVAKKHIAQFDAEVLKEINLEPGLVAEFFRGKDSSQKLRQRIDAQIDFDWAADSPDPAVPKDNFNIRWTGTLRLPQPGRYELILIANTGARVYLGEKLVIDGEDVSRKRNGISVPIDFGGDLSSLRVEYWDTTGLAKIRLLSRAPSSTKDEPIPASAFYHDSGSNPGK